MRRESYAFRFIDFLILVYSIAILVFLKDEIMNLRIVGVSLIAISIYSIIKVRKNPLLLVLFSLIGFMNISIGYKDFLMLGEGISSWQLEGLRSKPINVFNAKSVLITLAIVNLFVSEKTASLFRGTISDYRCSNKAVGYGGAILLWLIFLYSFVAIKENIGQSHYMVYNPIFEYCLIIYVFTWYYSSNLRTVNISLVLFAVAFFVRFSLIGDRSSVFMLLVMFFLLYFNKRIKLSLMLIILLVGIPFVNFIGIFRTYGSEDFSTLLRLTISDGYYVDTVSWAYYAGLAVSSLGSLFKPFQLFVSFVLSWFGIDYGVSDLNDYALNYSELYNNGGGFYSSFFYAYGGYIGVLFGAIVLGVIIRLIMKAKRKDMIVFKILLVVYSFRWYLYNPSTLFKGCLLYTALVFIFCSLIGKTRKNVNGISTARHQIARLK